MGSSAKSRISVALCTFNGGRYLGDQLSSIDRQSRQPDEIVIADDGSTDDTVELARTWAGRRSDTRVLLGSGRLGVTRNFERAISVCTGDLIALADQDDVWRDTRLERQEKEFAADPGLLLVHGDADLIDENGRSLGCSLFESLRISEDDRKRISSGDAYDVYIRRNLATGATTMFRRNLLSEALPFPEAWVHDEWLAILAAAHGKIRLLDDSLVLYRQHGRNQIGAADPGLLHRASRILEPRGERNRTLAGRAAQFAARLDTVRDSIRHDVVVKASEKAAFEERRAAFADGRLRRMPEVIREARRGDYARYASQGRLDILRDLLQPA